MRLDQVKSYLKVDGADSDADISALLLAATSYVNQQTGKKNKVTYDTDGVTVLSTIPISDDELYNLCLKLMISHWFENRGVEIPGQLTRITHSVDALVNHIAMCGDYV